MLVCVVAPFVLFVVVLIPIIISSRKSTTQVKIEMGQKAEKKKLSGKQRARIVLILIVLLIISSIADIIKKGSLGYSDMIDIPFNIVMIYCLVMFIGYPIARRMAEKGKKPKDL